MQTAFGLVLLPKSAFANLTQPPASRGREGSRPISYLFSTHSQKLLARPVASLRKFQSDKVRGVVTQWDMSEGGTDSRPARAYR